MNKKIAAYFLIAFLVFSYFFIVFDVSFRGPDEPIYFAYTASVIEDGDLNAVNQFYKSSAKFVSQTYNLPDFHNHGGTILWSPIYAYGRFFGSERSIKCALSFSTVVFGFLTLLFILLLCGKFFSVKTSVWSTVIMFLATPYFYYTFFEPGNGQIIASLLSVVSIFVLYYLSAMKRWHWFLYGMFFSICMIVKLDLWFQIFLILTYCGIMYIRKKIVLRDGLFFLLGFIPLTILNFINDYIKYGIIHKGEFALLNLHNFYLFEQLFSSYRGVFYTSPVFYISLLGFILVTVFLFKSYRFNTQNREKTIFLFLLGVYLFFKIFIISFRYAWGGNTTGARHLLTELPIFVLLYAYALENSKRYIRILIYVFSIIALVWNLLVISEFINRVDLLYVAQAPKFELRIKSLKVIFDLLIQPKEIWLKLQSFAWIIIAGAFFIIAAIRRSKRFSLGKFILKLLSIFTVYAFLAYSTISLLNISNNKRNVEVLKAQGFFSQSNVLDNCDYEKEENIISMDEMVRYFGKKRNYDMIEKIRKIKREMYGD